MGNDRSNWGLLVCTYVDRGSPEAGAISSDGPRSRVHMVARGQTAPILQLSIPYRMHRLPTLCGLILALALFIWGTFGGPLPQNG